MKRAVYVCALLLFTGVLVAQPKKVTESVTVAGQTEVELEFDFAENITFELWDKNEVLVEVMVEINDGRDNDIFTLASEKSGETIRVWMDKEMWKKIPKDRDDKVNCSYSSTINYTVYFSKGLLVSCNTISGDYELDYLGQSMNLRTISGAIDLTVPSSMGLDFRAKTISGEVYSDIDIKYPEGKSGLRQIVGQNFKGQINGGGRHSELETISGNIYLRKE